MKEVEDSTLVRSLTFSVQDDDRPNGRCDQARKRSTGVPGRRNETGRLMRSLALSGKLFSSLPTGVCICIVPCSSLLYGLPDDACTLESIAATNILGIYASYLIPAAETQLRKLNNNS
ncbi:hypothetical protein HZ326_25147 [Fusarium oxysporum f. sp. albedinis]|nr:hypothetical protein HZ326_25147 [Fusarium oxysporum f. sp. albedinis]